MKKLTFPAGIFLSLFFLLGAMAPGIPKQKIPAPPDLRDTLSIQEFTSLFQYQGKRVAPDSLEWVNCDFLLTFSEELWNNPPFDWDQYCLSVEGTIINLPFQGLPYSLTERKGGGYFASFLFVEAEVSNHMVIKSLDAQFRVIEGLDEMESPESLAYCGGDAGYEWYRDGQFVSDSVYIFRSVFLDEKYDTTWGSFVWDRQGKLHSYPLDVRPYIEQGSSLDHIPWLDLIKNHFPLKDTLLVVLDSSMGKEELKVLPKFYHKVLFSSYCENLEESNFFGACVGYLKPISYRKTHGGGYLLTFLNTWNLPSGLWLASFSKSGSFEELVLLSQYISWDRQTYSDVTADSLLINTRLLGGAWVDPDTVRVTYSLNSDEGLRVEKREEIIKPKP